MATRNQISFISLNKELINEPILIIGSKQYEFDKENIKTKLQEFEFKDITGIDLFEGEGVDYIADITNPDEEFIKEHNNFYSTVICMEILTHVKNPFSAANNITLLLKKGGFALLSECYVRKISKMPVDLWRFTYDGTKELFNQLTFDDSKAMLSLTREKKERLLELNYPMPQVLAEKHPDENSTGYFLRRVHRRFFADGIFKISRLLPETTIYSIAKK